MRSGACSVQQALTTEAASVLKLSLTLARRRGHAQVTPLHVAATLLTSTTSSSSTSNPLRRACLKSHPHHLASHPLQCRALELCFNVALNRLPTTPPPSSSSLIHSQPSLSNALIAALKRAQAHQRRGCIEQQQHFQQQQQQQQPLLAIKVELDQLIISILDDPSVSRVMREAGFSSTTVKNNLEEDAPVSSSSPLSPSNFFFDSSNREIITQATLLHTHFFQSPSEHNPVPHFSYKEDLRVVLEVMLRKQGRRNNTVVVGDSVSVTEGIVGELMGRVERGEVPDELKSSHFINLQLSYLLPPIPSEEPTSDPILTTWGGVGWCLDCCLSFCLLLMPDFGAVQSIKTKQAEQQKETISIRHVEALKQKIMKLRKENESLKRQLVASEP